MSKIWIAVIAGGAGIIVGLQIAKAYAKSEISDASHDVLSVLGLSGGKVESVVNKVVLPLIVN